MLIPLAASLLYIAYRNSWSHFAIFGLVATYLTCGLHKDTGSPLWQTQALFLVYWLIFEGFDLIRADPGCCPSTALGFLALSAGKWTHAAPGSTSGSSPPEPPSCTSAAPSCAPVPDAGAPPCSSTPPSPPPRSCSSCTTSGCPSPSLIRPNSTTSPASASAPLSAQSRGRRLRLQLGDLLAEVICGLPAARLGAGSRAHRRAFYLNRALQASEVWYGYVAAALAALVAGFEATTVARPRLDPDGRSALLHRLVAPPARFPPAGLRLRIPGRHRHRRLFPAARALARHRRRRGLHLRPL